MNPRAVLNKVQAATPPPASAGNTPQGTPTNVRTLRRMVHGLTSHVTCLTSPSTRRSVVSKLEKLSKAAQQALAEADILRHRVATLEATLQERQTRAKQGGRRLLTKATAVTGLELLKLRRKMEESSRGRRRGDTCRRGRGRIRHSSTPSSMELEETDEESLESLSQECSSVESVIVVASRR